jgi:hypothetical protein
MQFKNRIAKLETEFLPTTQNPCFCNNNAVRDWWSGKNETTLTYCRKCQPQFDFWKNLAQEAKEMRNRDVNLTDAAGDVSL